MAALFLIPLRIILAVVVLATASITVAQDDEHEEEQHEDNDAGNALVLTPQQRQANGIVVARAEKRSLKARIMAPGEVVLNSYASSQVTPRIASHALARHAVLGEEVRKNQPLARLSSVAMAEAQGELIIAANEWRRAQTIGKETLSGRRYTEAQVAIQQAMAKAQTYGMTEAQVKEFLTGNDVSKATGAYDLLSPQDGTVISDNFLVGERIEPGHVLFELTDESSMWIEARLAASKALEISKETPTRISNDSVHWKDGEIVQIHHSLDEQTRTRIVRIEVDNEDDSLHPGEFVQVEFLTGPGEIILAVPASSLVVMEGSSVVFRLLEGDELIALPVEVVLTSGNWVGVHAELTEGDEIVVEGAYGLKSEFLKSERSAGHSH